MNLQFYLQQHVCVFVSFYVCVSVCMGHWDRTIIRPNNSPISMVWAAVSAGYPALLFLLIYCMVLCYIMLHCNKLDEIAERINEDEMSKWNEPHLSLVYHHTLLGRYLFHIQLRVGGWVDTCGRYIHERSPIHMFHAGADPGGHGAMPSPPKKTMDEKLKLSCRAHMLVLLLPLMTIKQLINIAV